MNPDATVNVAFSYDLSNPTITETVINTTNLVNEGTGFSLSGTISDTNAVAGVQVEVSKNGGAYAVASTQTYTGTSQAWSFSQTVDTSGAHADDATYAYRITASDAAGKTTTINRSILVDTQQPNATVTAPTAATWLSSTSYAVTGSAGDNSGGSGVKEIWTLVDAASVDHSSDTSTAITTGGSWKKATGAANWNYTWNLGSEGAKKLWVAVEDNAGNWTSTYSSVAFGLDTANPSLAETAISTTSTVSRNATVAFGGTATDSNPAAAPTLAVSVDGGA